MKSIFSLLFLASMLLSCNKQSDLQKAFNCSANISFNNLEKVEDFNKSFSVKTPKSWATKLFYNDYESAIMTADSLKTFSKTYILNVSLISGELEINEEFTTKTTQKLIQDKFTKIDFKKVNFKNLPSIWFLSSIENQQPNYHYFQLFVKKSETDYLEISTKIFGEELVDERLCESIALMNEIEF